LIDARNGVSRFLARCGALVALVTVAAPAVIPAAHAASGNGHAGAPLDIRDIHVQSRQTFSYTCASGKTFKVSYFNASNGQSFALLPVDGRKVLLVGVVAASGVKYVGDRYAWWTKGPGGDLYDTMADPNAKPIVAGCATIMR
jgi:membrane-bound inhibitor of C-type lysozyme